MDEYIQSTGFSAGTTGFKIEGGGDAEFGNITARGELQTFGVLEGTQSAYGGELVVASGVAKLFADVAVGDESIDVSSNDLRSLDNLQFQPTATRVEWMRVREAGTPITGGFRFPVDRAIAGTEQAFTAGEIGVELEVRMIDENDILLVSDTEPEFNRHQAGYVNTGGMQQMTSLPGND